MHRPRQPLRISRSARRARRDRRRRARPRGLPPRRARRARPAHPGDAPCAAPFQRGRAARRGPLGRALCRAQATRRSSEILNFIATGGYALKAYDQFRRLVPRPAGMWRIAKPSFAQQHRLNAGVIVEQPLHDRPLPERPQARHGRGRLRLDARRPATTSSSPGSASRSSSSRTPTSSSTPRPSAARIVTYGGAAHVDVDPPRQPRPRTCSPTATTGTASPTTSANGSRCSPSARSCPSPHQLLVETFPHEGRHYMVAYSFEGWNAHQSLGMLITRRMEKRGPEAARLRRQRLCARLLRARADHRPASALLAPTSSSRSSSTGSRARTCSRPRSARWR